MTEVFSPQSNTFKAQFGEDRLLDDFFGHKCDGFYIEIGAHNGVHLSNSYHFEQIEWQGLLIEADPELAAECRKSRPTAEVVHCAVVAPGASAEVEFLISLDLRGHSSLSLNERDLKKIEQLAGSSRTRKVTVPARTLDSILEEYQPASIDFITVDVEGYEWDVLRGFNIGKWRPRFILLERNATLPDGRIMRYMRRNSYRFERTTGPNDWFCLVDPGTTSKPSYKFWLLRNYYVPCYRATLSKLIKSMRQVAKRVLHSR